MTPAAEKGSVEGALSRYSSAAVVGAGEKSLWLACLLTVFHEIRTYLDTGGVYRGP